LIHVPVTVTFLGKEGMKHKTLFRLLLKAIGVWVFAAGANSLFVFVTNLVVSFTFGGANRGYYWMSLIGPTFQTCFGLYLFFGGKWIVDMAIPSNRPYCHECGYELTNASGNRCTECGTPFAVQDVAPGVR
jgi:hypothetical protein